MKIATFRLHTASLLQAMRSTGHVWCYKAWCSAVISCFSTALIGAFRSLLFTQWFAPSAVCCRTALLLLCFLIVGIPTSCLFYRKVKVHSDKFSPLRVHRQQWDDLRQRDHGIFRHRIAVYQRSYRCRCTSRIAETRERPKPGRLHHANACVHKSLTLWPSFWDPHTSSITDRFMSKKMPPPWGVQFPLSLLTYT